LYVGVSGYLLASAGLPSGKLVIPESPEQERMNVLRTRRQLARRSILRDVFTGLPDDH